MIRLIPMNEANYQAYLSTAIAEYAQGHADAGNWTAESALNLATQQYKVHELGLHTISLHVFGYNHPARAMYEKLGYITTNVQMMKSI